MRVYLCMTTGGCLEQSEIEQMMRGFQQQGYETVTDPAHADRSVVNPCAVTQNAVIDRRSQIALDNACALHGIRANFRIVVMDAGVHQCQVY